ncbi:MAG: hypothetical protein U0354_08990 [Candidatus Sericytochromatia bacterium]
MRIITKVLSKMSNLKESSKKFIEKVSNGIFCSLGKNFRNISRYIELNEKQSQEII